MFAERCKSINRMFVFEMRGGFESDHMRLYDVCAKKGGGVARV